MWSDVAHYRPLGQHLLSCINHTAATRAPFSLGSLDGSLEILARSNELGPFLSVSRKTKKKRKKKIPVVK